MISVENKFEYIVSHHLGLSSPLNFDARFKEELHLDSLDVADLIVEVEKEFGIRIPDPQADAINTIGDLRSCVIRRMETNER